MRGVSLVASWNCLAVVALLACLPPAGAWAEQGDLRQQTDEVLSQGDIQRNAPLAERVRSEASDVAGDNTLQHTPPNAHREMPARPASVPVPGNLFLYLLLVTLAICVGAVLFHLFRTYAPRRGGRIEADGAVIVAAEGIRTPDEAPLPPLDEIERLARAGAYAEAIHLMLLRALESVRQRLGANWAKSLTSREILRRAELLSSDRQALKVLVGAVEICRFGGQQANEQVYHACLGHYRAIGSGTGTAAA